MKKKTKGMVSKAARVPLSAIGWNEQAQFVSLFFARRAELLSLRILKYQEGLNSPTGESNFAVLHHAFFGKKDNANSVLGQNFPRLFYIRFLHCAFVVKSRRCCLFS